MKTLNNKAFTLTELLMVVLMIGVLSAFVLPKYTRVVDSFRVLEAEQMMQAVRNEQEMRCTLGKKYTAEAGKVKKFAKTKASGNKYVTANFTYTLTNLGMKATSLNGGGYTLELPYYLDGRICCDECGNFTKNYVTCGELNNEDLQKAKENDACKAN